MIIPRSTITQLTPATKHMKKFCLLFLVLYNIVPSTFSQSENIDSLRQIVKADKRDSATSKAYFELGNYYFTALLNYDSGMVYAQRGAGIAAAAHFLYGEAKCQNLIGNIYWRTGSYDKSLEAFLIALKCIEKGGTEVSYGIMLTNIGNVYAALGDYEKSNEYTYRGNALAEKGQAKASIMVNFLNLGDNYFHLRFYDSARSYAGRAYSMALELGDMEMAGLAMGNTGQVYSATGEHEIALGYYRKAINILGNNFNTIEISLGMAKVFQQQGLPDSALYYGRKSFQEALSLKLTPEVLAASLFMADHYKQYREVDSAYRYLNHVIAAKDSLFNQEKTRQIQAMFYEETARQQKLEQAKIEETEERSHNIQYAIIAVGVICFLVVILLLSRSVIVNEKWIRFLGVLGLLLLFEFINLLIHPFLGSITHHSPSLMFFALVIIAAFLIPVHHRVEHYILKRLTVKNRILRLEAARRTVAELEKQDADQ